MFARNTVKRGGQLGNVAPPRVKPIVWITRSSGHPPSALLGCQPHQSGPIGRDHKRYPRALRWQRNGASVFGDEILTLHSRVIADQELIEEFHKFNEPVGACPGWHD